LIQRSLELTELIMRKIRVSYFGNPYDLYVIVKIKQKAQEIKDEIVQYDSQLQNIEGAVKDKYNFSFLQSLRNSQKFC